ncbi:MAG: hypothetical protein NTZ56_24620 [Acidobacteria bacterium]|nr:hypothetical protein [Acidobacteriota bacterium]
MLASIFVLSVVKLILSTMGRLFQEATQDSATSAAAGAGPGTGTGSSSRGAGPTKGAELRKCAVCGTYAPVQSAPKVKGTDAFLCSDACAANWRG